MQIGCESLTDNHDDPGQSGREDLNLRLQGSESSVLLPFCRVPPDGSSNVSTASSAESCIRKAVTEHGFLGGKPLPLPKRCWWPGSWKVKRLRVPSPMTRNLGDQRGHIST